MKYFPFLRGKQHEILALSSLVSEITATDSIVPILEPVNWNSTTTNALNRFKEQSMNFLFICNPRHGDLCTDQDFLCSYISDLEMMDHICWVPTIYLYESTTQSDLTKFLRMFNKTLPVAFVYYGRPHDSGALAAIRDANVVHHVFLSGRIDTAYLQTVPIEYHVQLADRFRRQPRNADYPDRELFTDMNTTVGNETNVNFGDFSIVGDHFTTGGGAAHAVALHHIHFDSDSNNLMIHHFKSDRRDSAVDTPGKTHEALSYLVNSLNHLRPNDTQACAEYRELFDTENFRGLGYMKRLAVKHHLETILQPEGLEKQANKT